MYTYYVKCGKILTNGYGTSRYETKNNTANKILDKLVSISEIDDHLRTNPACLKSNEARNDAASNEQSMFTNFIGKLQELCLTRAWNLPKYQYYQVIEVKYNNKEHLYTVICSAGPYESKA